MVKVILEKQDIVNLIKAKYETAVVESGLAEDIQIFIKVDEIKTASLKDSVQTIPPKVVEFDPKKIVRDADGNIDAVKSGLTNKNPPVTKPGGQMGRQRGRLPTF